MLKRRLIGLVLLLLACGGCSSFERDWQRSLSAAPATAPATIEGRWEGRWSSRKGHGSGRLRCLLTKVDDRTYAARFRATFWGFMKAGYTVMLNAAPADAGVRISGEKDLGWLAGGIYRYEGQITAAEFTARYSSRSDDGDFTLARP